MSDPVDLGDRDLGEAGLTEALARLRDRLPDPNIGNPLISLAETLEWCYSLEQFHGVRLTGRAYETQRDASTEGQALAGLMYARGRFTHTLIATAHVVTGRPGRTLVMGGRGRRGGRTIMRRGAHTEYVWKSVLPGRRGDPGQKSYGLYVAGKTVLPPIEAAQRFLTGIA